MRMHAQDMVAKLRGLFMQGGDQENSPERQQILAIVSESVRQTQGSTGKPMTAIARRTRRI